MLEQLEVYISAQKTIANYFMGVGVFILLLAVIFHFLESNTLFSGLKIGLLVVGLVSLGSGYGYFRFTTNLSGKQTELHRKDPVQFHQVEKDRMEKVVKSFTVYQISFVVVISICLLVILFIDNNLIKGLLFSIIIFILSNMIVETVSKPSIYNYHQQLIKKN